MVELKSKREMEIMKEACKIANLTQKEVEKHIKPGISTIELDRIAENFIKAQKALPAQKNYPHPEKGVKPFPATLCISINDTVIHGIPSKKIILKNGDIVNVFDEVVGNYNPNDLSCENCKLNYFDKNREDY